MAFAATGATGATGDAGPTVAARKLHFYIGITITLTADVLGSANVTYPPGTFSGIPNVHATARTGTITTRGSSKTSGIYGVGVTGSTKDGCIVHAVSKSSGTFSFDVVAMAVG